MTTDALPPQPLRRVPSPVRPALAARPAALGGFGGPGGFGSPLGYGRDRTFRLLLIGIAILAIGNYLGRNWHRLF